MEENRGSLPRPTFETRGPNKNRICQICLVGCVAKHQATRKMEKNSDNVNFKVYAEKWKNNIRKYNKVFGFVVCQNSFFSIWFFFHEHSRYTGQQGKREAISLTPL